MRVDDVLSFLFVRVRRQASAAKRAGGGRRRQNVEERSARRRVLRVAHRGPALGRDIVLGPTRGDRGEGCGARRRAAANVLSGADGRVALDHRGVRGATGHGADGRVCGVGDLFVARRDPALAATQHLEQRLGRLRRDARRTSGRRGFRRLAFLAFLERVRGGRGDLRRWEQRRDHQLEGIQRVRFPRRAQHRLGVFVAVEQVQVEPVVGVGVGVGVRRRGAHRVVPDRLSRRVRVI